MKNLSFILLAALLTAAALPAASQEPAASATPRHRTPSDPRFGSDDFVSAFSNPRTPEEPAIVLRVPKAEQNASRWDPKEKLPISPEKAIELVLSSDLLKDERTTCWVYEVHLSSMHPMLSSDSSPVPPGANESQNKEGSAPASSVNDGRLITSYRITVSSRRGSIPFMVLMNGKVFPPVFEKQPSSTSGR